MNALLLACIIAIAGLAAASNANTFDIDFYPVTGKTGGDGDDVLCELCINTADDLINALLNYILNHDVIGGCANLCSHAPTDLQGICTIGESRVPEKSPNALSTHCLFTQIAACDLVGLKAFINIIENSDLDPIWYARRISRE